MKTEVITPNIITASVLELSYGDNVSEAIKVAKESYMSYIEYISKPVFDKNSDSLKAMKYAEELKKYEADIIEYNKQKSIVAEHNANVDKQIELYIKEVSEFNSIVPNNKKAKVWSKAWSDGHSEGLHNVYYHLIELVDLFK